MRMEVKMKVTETHTPLLTLLVEFPPKSPLLFLLESLATLPDFLNLFSCFSSTNKESKFNESGNMICLIVFPRTFMYCRDVVVAFAELLFVI